MMLGTSENYTYTKEQLLTILKTSPGSGRNADASLILAHQLIEVGDRVELVTAVSARSPGQQLHCGE
jgi:hypothetical protein